MVKDNAILQLFEHCVSSQNLHKCVSCVIKWMIYRAVR
jgi:hypothetical protein